jgi:hypothetical protein
MTVHGEKNTHLTHAIWSWPRLCLPLICSLPPWDARCDKAGAAFFPTADWYKPVYSTTPAAAAPTAAPTAAPATTPGATYIAPAGEAAPSASTAPAPAPAPTAAAVEVPAAAPTAAVAVPASAGPVLAAGNSAPAPMPLDTRMSSGAGSAVGNVGALLLAGLAAVCLLL